MRISVLLSVLLVALPPATSLTLPQIARRHVSRGACLRALRMASPSEEEERKEIAAMRIKAIKAELESLMVPHQDAFEKDDLVQRLVDARRQKAPDGAPEQNDSAPSMGQSMGMCVYMLPQRAARGRLPHRSRLSTASFAPHARRLENLLRDPEGPAVLAQLEREPRLMNAAMDIAGNGNAADYKDDPEVLAFLRKLEEITKRAGASAAA